MLEQCSAYSEIFAWVRSFFSALTWFLRKLELQRRKKLRITCATNALRFNIGPFHSLILTVKAFAHG